ncbi:MAG TPA: hypothetical protein VMU50_00930, partial [Polyangia bacterium]|nr:hypothetical protein [Polyangia bacterium]
MNGARGVLAAVALAAAGAAVAPGAAAWGQGRPDESSMFGGGAAPEKKEAAPAPAPPQPSPLRGEGAGDGEAAKGVPPAAANEAPPGPAGTARDQFVLGDPNVATKMGADAAPENPLTIGGQLYLRAQSSAPTHTDPRNWSLTAPSLLDAFFDARPNDRVRAFILGRMSFDPTQPPASSSSATSPASLFASSSSTTSAAQPATGFTTISAGRGPFTLLDQMWLAFDIEHKVFVTAGKQHVKWGTGHSWTPTDYLHPTKRNPLDVFDVRGGVSMVRLQIPWEERAWNFYAFAVSEDPLLATSKLGNVAGALRAEMVILGAELGLDVFAKSGQRPRFGVD